MEKQLKQVKGIPFYLQLKDILKQDIRDGVFKDHKLPPVREIARIYGVSVNTGLRAYNELRREGLITSDIGRGTFIAENPASLQDKNVRKLVKTHIKNALEEAVSLGMSMDEFEEAVSDFVDEQKEKLARVSIAFIECNIEQLNYFTSHLELDPSVHLIPILLSDLHRPNKETKQRLSKADVLLTSFYHLNEVESHLGNREKPLIGINLEPEMRTIVEIAKIPREATVGVVTTSSRFRKIVKEVLENLGLHFEQLVETSSGDQETIHKLVDRCDTVLVSPKRKKTVMEYIRPGTKVIEFIFTPDRTSINNIKVAIMELKNTIF